MFRLSFQTAKLQNLTNTCIIFNLVEFNQNGVIAGSISIQLIRSMLKRYFALTNKRAFQDIWFVIYYIHHHDNRDLRIQEVYFSSIRQK